MTFLKKVFCDIPQRLVAEERNYHPSEYPNKIVKRSIGKYSVKYDSSIQSQGKPTFVFVNFYKLDKTEGINNHEQDITGVTA